MLEFLENIAGGQFADAAASVEAILRVNEFEVSMRRCMHVACVAGCLCRPHGICVPSNENTCA